MIAEYIDGGVIHIFGSRKLAHDFELSMARKGVEPYKTMHKEELRRSACKSLREYTSMVDEDFICLHLRKQKLGQAIESFTRRYDVA